MNKLYSREVLSNLDHDELIEICDRLQTKLINSQQDKEALERENQHKDNIINKFKNITSRILYKIIVSVQCNYTFITSLSQQELKRVCNMYVNFVFDNIDEVMDVNTFFAWQYKMIKYENDPFDKIPIKEVNIFNKRGIKSSMKKEAFALAYITKLLYSRKVITADTNIRFNWKGKSPFSDILKNGCEISASKLLALDNKRRKTSKMLAIEMKPSNAQANMNNPNSIESVYQYVTFNSPLGQTKKDKDAEIVRSIGLYYLKRIMKDSKEKGALNKYLKVTGHKTIHPNMKDIETIYDNNPGVEKYILTTTRYAIAFDPAGKASGDEVKGRLSYLYDGSENIKVNNIPIPLVEKNGSVILSIIQYETKGEKIEKFESEQRKYHIDKLNGYTPQNKYNQGLSSCTKKECFVVRDSNISNHLSSKEDYLDHMYNEIKGKSAGVVLNNINELTSIIKDYVESLTHKDDTSIPPCKMYSLCDFNFNRLKETTDPEKAQDLINDYVRRLVREENARILDDVDLSYDYVTKDNIEPLDIDSATSQEQILATISDKLRGNILKNFEDDTTDIHEGFERAELESMKQYLNDEGLAMAFTNTNNESVQMNPKEILSKN